MSTIKALAGVFAVVVAGFGCAASAEVSEEESASVESAAKADCTLVRCALPKCLDGQTLTTRPGQCCPVCTSKPDASKCAAVMCAAVVCPDGQQLVTSPGDCCGHCVGKPKTAECVTDLDCPQVQCFACPCPVSACLANQCVSSTPDESTCGAQ